MTVLVDGTTITYNDSTTQTSSRGVAKVWASWNGVGGASINASFNVSSVSYNGTGNYTVNFSSALQDSAFTVTTTGGCPNSGGSDNDLFGIYAVGGTPAVSTTSVRLWLKRVGQGGFDTRYAGVAIFR